MDVCAVVAVGLDTFGYYAEGMCPRSRLFARRQAARRDPLSQSQPPPFPASIEEKPRLDYTAHARPVCDQPAPLLRQQLRQQDLTHPDISIDRRLFLSDLGLTLHQPGAIFTANRRRNRSSCILQSVQKRLPVLFEFNC